MLEFKSDIYIEYSVNVHLPKDRISMAHQGYGFCEFLTEEDAEYACKIMNQIKLWGKPIRVNKVRRRFSIHLQTSSNAARHDNRHWVIVTNNHFNFCLGFFRQKATRRRCQPIHWQSGRQCR
jgi:RNA recognition motif-containing protein